MNDTISCIYYLTREVDFVAEGKKNLVVTIDEELHQKFKIHGYRPVSSYRTGDDN